MKSKGFTLVELLVVIVILGIITGISIPIIRNIQAKNEMQKYTTYGESLESSAKLYNDSYAEDLFGHRQSGCVYVSYAQLEEKGLLKDIPLADVSCKSENTFVKIIKIGDKYTYKYYMGCGKEKDGAAESIDTILPDSDSVHEMDYDLCSLNNDASIEISAENINGDPKKSRKTKIVLTSLTGINQGVEIFATWRQDKNFEAVADSEWVKAQFNVPTNQLSELELGNSISTKSQEYVTPPNQNGNFYLLVSVERLDDAFGESWKNPNSSNGKYVSFGPFKVDSTPPTCISSGASTTWSATPRTIIYGCQDENGCDPAFSGGSITYSNSVTQATVPQYTIKDKAGNETVCAAQAVNVYVDNTKPVIQVTQNPLGLGTQDYEFINNITVTWGPSGVGTAYCNPALSRKTGMYQVTCDATSPTGIEANSESFDVRHSYPAAHNANQCGQSWKCTKGHCITNQTDGTTGSWGCFCSNGNWNGGAGEAGVPLCCGFDFEPNYCCPAGGTLNNTTHMCVYN